jgi:hypothetical protein
LHLIVSGDAFLLYRMVAFGAGFFQFFAQDTDGSLELRYFCRVGLRGTQGRGVDLCVCSFEFGTQGDHRALHVTGISLGQREFVFDGRWVGNHDAEKEKSPFNKARTGRQRLPARAANTNPFMNLTSYFFR